MKDSNPVFTILAALGLLFSLIIILFIDVDSFGIVKKLSYSWLAFVIGILALFGGFFFMLNRKIWRELKVDNKHLKLWLKEFGKTFLKQGLPLITVLILIKIFTNWI